ncbi:hypothetical protein SDC9_157477 [bioreactor metagenome]|uniref:CBS domain-containing protein n=1 Tax=bioreactor metagenome TaxID=1076179 RepID=A0A645F9F1_9ZZZZ
MDRQPLSVDYKTSAGLVFELAMKRCADHIYDDIIVTKNEVYHGVVSIKDLVSRSRVVL